MKVDQDEVLVNGVCVKKSFYGIPFVTLNSIVANKTIAEILLHEHYEELKDTFEKGQKYYQQAASFRRQAITKKDDEYVIDYELTGRYRGIEEKADRLLKNKIIELLNKHNINDNEVNLDFVELWVVAKFTTKSKFRYEKWEVD